MKTLHKTILTAILLIAATCVFAQDKEKIKGLVDQGVALNDSGKYTAAIDKYNEALKLDPENLRALYEMSYTLSSSGRTAEAIPILEKIVATNSYREAYNLLGNIYDDANEFEKAIACYRSGLVTFPKYSRLYFNLGISYLRQKKFPEAEAAAIEAIKLDPQHASNQRVYAQATYYENKRGCSLLAWCSFLMLEPQTKRSAEAYTYIEAILNYGIKRTGEKSVNISVSTSDLNDAGNLAMPIAILASTDNKKNLTAADSLTLQLTSVFGILAEREADKQTFYSNFYAKYFGKLAVSGNMPAFARTMDLSSPESEKWVNDHPQYMNDLYTWVKTTRREF